MNTTCEIARVFEIDMGHRLVKHESKCRNVHGHRYKIEVYAMGLKLDGVGRVIDFGVMKTLVGQWLDDVFDHGFAVEQGDPMLEFLKEHAQKYVELDCPPTVENLVEIWFDGAAAILAQQNIIVTRVRAYETPNCWAEYTIANARANGKAFVTKVDGAPIADNSGEARFGA